MSLEPYGSVLDLGILRESHTGTYMGTGYAILSVPKNDNRFSPLSHHLPWYQSDDEGFYAVWSDMPTYCRYCHAEGHAVSDCPKKRSSRVCWNCRASGHTAAECAKSKNKPFKKARKTPTAPQDCVDRLVRYFIGKNHVCSTTIFDIHSFSKSKSCATEKEVRG
ncbi:hypothetical protein G6F44_007138 [Rhizopus delemar]|nr:hypothetical protein G6F44_007138 [Rhizopus delemar]